MNQYFSSLLLCLGALFFCAQAVIAQVPPGRTCDAMVELDRQFNLDPTYKKRLDQIEEHTHRIIQSGARDGLGVITIPVVVHILYKNQTENLSDAQINSQIDVLNEDFRRLNSDTTSVWSQAADIEIEFCLAGVDPNGLATTGITRTPTTNNSFQGNSIKFDSQGGKNAWPRDRYLNMWVGDIGSGLLGFATFPGGPASVDGVVVNYRYFGDFPFATPPFNRGRTATHEVGHWLNLRHMWGGGGCSSDDLVGDTPNAENPNYGCPRGRTSCSTTDMIENYMDYTDDGCMNLFTEGQKTRMRALFAPGGSREALLSSTVCCPESPSCPIVSNWSVESLTDSSVRIILPLADSGNTFSIRYQTEGSFTWDTLSGFSDTTLLLAKLDRCTDYIFELQSVCTNENSLFNCNQQVIQTFGCCESPSLTVFDQEADSATFSWRPVYGALEYQFRYRLLDDSAWTFLPITDTSLLLNGLLGCNAYEYQFRSSCKVRDTLTGNFSLADTFEVPFNPAIEGCIQCNDTNYCVPQVTGGLGWIGDIDLGPISQTANGSGTFGFTNNSQSNYIFEIDSTYSFSMSTGNNSPQEWKLWIDLNQNGFFEDSTELLFEELTPAVDVSGTITLDANLLTGPTRLRIGSRLPTAPLAWDACNMMGFGEFEDYCINLQAPCNAVTDVVASIDTAGEIVNLSWTGDPQLTYEYGYLLDGDTAWTSFEVMGNSLSLGMDSLFGCSVYDFRVRQACANGSNDFAFADAIKTVCGVNVEVDLAERIRLYPNPAKDLLRIKAPIDIQSIQILDVRGGVFIQQTIDEEDVRLNVGELPEGIYLIRIEVKGQAVWKRILIQR